MYMRLMNAKLVLLLWQQWVGENDHIFLSSIGIRVHKSINIWVHP